MYAWEQDRYMTSGGVLKDFADDALTTLACNLFQMRIRKAMGDREHWNLYRPLDE